MVAKKSSSWHRVASAGLLLFVLFLPLHVHAGGGSGSFAKECACVYGQRTQLAMPADAIAIVPQLQSFVLVVVAGDVWFFDCRTACSVRGPPVSRSL